MGKKSVNNDMVKSDIECYIDLSLFDANTGEVYPKHYLPKDEQEEVTACEEMLKILDGVPDKDLAIPKEKIREYISKIYEGFKKCNDECTARGFVSTDLNKSGEVSFRKALDVLDGYEAEKDCCEKDL